MKKTFLSAALLLTAIAASAQAGTAQTLTVNGQTVSQTVVHMSFQGNNVLLSFADGTSLTTDMRAVSITFGSPASVGSLTAYTLQPPVGNQLAIGPLPQGAWATLYDAGGKQLLRTNQPVVDLKGLKPGIYLLKADSQVIKFTKK